MRYVVLGAGMMGRAVAHDLATFQSNDDIVLADIDLEAATSAARSISPRVRPVRLDVGNDAALERVLEGTSAVVSAVSPCSRPARCARPRATSPPWGWRCA